MNTTFKRWALILLLIALGLAGTGVALAGPGGPEPGDGTVKAADTYTLYSGYVTTTTTINPASVTRLVYYNDVDLFVTADFSTTGVITMTPQYSADNANWANATYVGTAWSSATVDGITTTIATADAETTYRTTLSADGTDFIRLPMVGKYLRPQITLSGGVTNGVWITVTAIARN